MKILILGASGRTGILLTREALARGHQVHVLVRNARLFTLSHAKLTVFEGIPNDRDDLSKAINGCEAVLSTLNVSRKSDFPWAPLRAPKNLLSSTMALLIDSCGQFKINRILIISASGVGDSKGDAPGWFHWLIRNSNIGYAYADHEKQESMLLASTVDWTIVRPVGLTNHEKEKDIIVSYRGQPKPRFTISRNNTARFMLDALEQNTFIKKAPTISELK